MSFTGKISKSLADELMENSEKTLRFISEIKWQNGFICHRCGNTNYCEGRTPFSRRCTKCKKEESATAHTIFHNIKFPVNKAFYIVYNICVLNKDNSAINFANLLDINQMTCWKFKKRVMECVNKKNEGKNINIKMILMGNF